MIPCRRQDISQADIIAVVVVQHSHFLTQGPVPGFMKVVGGYWSADHAVAVSTTTSALHIACLTLCVERGGSL